jgi:hypothetical protein
MKFSITVESWSDMFKQLREASGIPSGSELKLKSVQLPFTMIKAGGTLADPRPVSNCITALGLFNNPASLIINLLTPSDDLTDEDFATAGVGIVIGIFNLLNRPSAKSQSERIEAEEALLELLRPGGVVFEKCLTKTKIIPAGTGYLANGIANYLGNGSFWVKDGPVCYRKSLVVSLLESWGPEIARLGWTPHHDISAELELGLDKNLLLFYLADEISAKFLVHAPVLLRLQLLRQF